MQHTGDVLASITAEPGRSGIKKEVIAMNENFNTPFVDVKKQREQMDKVMTVFRDFKEETERLSDWLQQADINIKASKTSLLSTIKEKEEGVRDINELNKRLIGGKKKRFSLICCNGSSDKRNMFRIKCQFSAQRNNEQISTYMQLGI